MIFFEEADPIGDVSRSASIVCQLKPAALQGQGLRRARPVGTSAMRSALGRHKNRDCDDHVRKLTTASEVENSGVIETSGLLSSTNHRGILAMASIARAPTDVS